MSESRLPWALAAAGLAFAAIGLFVWKKGGVAAAAQSIGSSAGTAVVSAMSGAVSGAAGAIGAPMGLPTPDKTVTDPAQARWIIDNVGQFEASKWASAYAYLRAQFMSAGTGTPPPVDSPAGREFRYYLEAAQWQDYTDDENERLLGRYPVQLAPVTIDAYRRRPGEM